MKAILPAVLVLLFLSCGGVKPAALDIHLPAVEGGSFLDSFYRQGWEQLRRGETDAAYRSFQNSMAPLDKKQAAFGYVFLSRRKFSAAAAQFDRALESDPANLEAAMGRAAVLELEGRTRDAFRAYGDLLLRVPEDAWVRLKYEAIRSAATQALLLEAEQARGRDQERYVRALEQALFYAPDMAAVSLQLADHYQALGDLARSQPLYEAVLAKEPHNEAVLLKLAALYEQGEKFDLALVTLDRLLALKPGDPFLEGEKRRLGDRFQQLTLPEKFKRIFFKTEITREDLAALIGFYFDRYLEIDRAPEILTDIDGSFAREQIIKTVTTGVMSARPDHTFHRFDAPNRARLAVTLKALIDFLQERGRRLRFEPADPAPLAADLSPLHREHDVIQSLLRSQVLLLDAGGLFNPTRLVSPAEAVQALKKIFNAIEE